MRGSHSLDHEVAAQGAGFEAFEGCCGVAVDGVGGEAEGQFSV